MLWKLLTPRLKEAKPDDFVFTVGLEDDQWPLTRDVLRRLLVRMGERPEVANVYPHRFRHTFAIPCAAWSRTSGTAATFSRCRNCWGTRTWRW